MPSHSTVPARESTAITSLKPDRSTRGRGRFELSAEMNANMAERFNVSGALLVKLFGHPRRESADFAEKAGKVRRKLMNSDKDEAEESDS